MLLMRCGRRYRGAAIIFLLGVLCGCATTSGIRVLDAKGRPKTITPEEVSTCGATEQPYLLQVGDQIALSFAQHTLRQGEVPWDYRIEVGDSMEVRLSEDSADREKYRIDVGDVVGISFLNNWPLNVTRTVRPDGKITVTEVGDMQAAGLTAEQLRRRLTDAYAASGLIQGEPKLTVNVDFVNGDRLDAMSRNVVVRPDGGIRLPMLKEDVHVAGLTLGEASEVVRKAASQVLRNPPVVGLVVFPATATVLSGMGGTFAVRPDGRISIPRLGDVQAAGFSLEEFSKNLREKCAQVAHNPVDVAANLLAATGSRVYVGGEVNASGVYPLDANPTVLQAILLAQGPKNTARMNQVLVIRRNSEGKPFVFQTNLHAALFKGLTENDFPLRAFDIVYVPKKPIAKANLFVEQYIEEIVPFDNNLGVNAAYYINEQKVDSKSRSTTLGLTAIPGFP
ncbi:MAG: polysaccharide biosynthesis/export family protein [Candidatus Hydrogenedentes bacterium]|nr:polysaccharide biosynthesis/export family protein [Candidatus Hydrogenedentota bacterium]